MISNKTCPLQKRHFSIEIYLYNKVNVYYSIYTVYTYIYMYILSPSAKFYIMCYVFYVLIYFVT